MWLRRRRRRRCCGHVTRACVAESLQRFVAVFTRGNQTCVLPAQPACHAPACHASACHELPALAVMFNQYVAAGLLHCLLLRLRLLLLQPFVASLFFFFSFVGVAKPYLGFSLSLSHSLALFRRCAMFFEFYNCLLK